MNVLDLFSGIGGFSLGLEAVGMNTVAFCEIDKNCHKVLNKHWPNVPVHKDIKELRGEDFKNIDVICGGFPCQDISVGGSQKGINKGSRSGLWKEYRRVINEAKPEWIIIENVERLRKNGLGIVLNDLSKIGYDAEWHCITARCIGLPHQRDRLWIIAYPREFGQYGCNGEKRHIQINEKRKSKEVHSNREQCELKPREICQILSKRDINSFRSANPHIAAPLSSICRVTNGLSKELERDRKARIKQLGNSVIPQIVEIIGRAIRDNKKL